MVRAGAQPTGHQDAGHEDEAQGGRGGIVVVLEEAALDDVAEDDVLDLRGRDPRPLERAPGGGEAELHRGDVFESTAERPERRPGAGQDHYLVIDHERGAPISRRR